MKHLILIFMLSFTFLFGQNTKKDILLGEYHKIYSKSIGEEREYYVSLPRGYQNSTKEYPVLYMMDGDWNFSDGNIGGIRYLEMQREIPELIIVGILNTNRSRDMFPWEFTRRNGTKDGGGANKFLTFLSDELMPVINKKYRTSDYKIFYGTSNSALTGVYDLLGYKQSYDAYLCSSPTLERSQFQAMSDSLVNNWKGKEKYLNLIVGEKDYFGLPKANADLHEKIGRKRLNEIKLKFTIMEGERHVPQTALIVGLKDLFMEYKFHLPVVAENLSDYIKHHEKISKKFNTEFFPSENALNVYAYSLLGDEKTKDKALEVFKYTVEKYPNSFNAFDSLGEAYMTLGDNKLAVSSYEKSLKLNPQNENAVKKIKEIKEKM